MYTSKYSIPLEIQSSTPRPARKRKSKQATHEYSWTDVLRDGLRLIWSLIAGFFYFLATTWRTNPWLKSLPWMRLIILGAVAYLLLGSNMVLDNEPGNKESLGWLWSGENEEGKDEEPTEATSVDSKQSKITTPLAKKGNNSVAPAEPESLETIAVKDFIQRFSKTAKEEMELFGIPASIKMAQAIIESQSGNSVLAKGSNNFFGIKCKAKCKSCTCRNYADDDPYDMFRVFDSAWESWREHSKLLCNPRYSKLPLYGKDYKKWAKGLKAAGYATDPSYDKKLIAVIQKYNLTKLDR